MNKFLKIIKKNIPILIFLIYICVFLFLVLSKYYSFGSDWALDFGLQNNIFWNYLKTGKVYSNIGVDLYPHAWNIFIILSPFYAIWSHPETLLVLKVILFALGGFPVYWLSKKLSFPPSLQVMAMLAYYLNGGSIKLVLNDLSPITLALPLLMFAFYFFYSQKIVLYLIFTALALSCRIEIFLAFLGFLLYGLFNIKKYKKMCLYTLILLIVFYILLPYMPFFKQGTGYYSIPLLFESYLQDIIGKSFLFNFNSEKILFALELLLPFALLMVFSKIGRLLIGSVFLFVMFIPAFFSTKFLLVVTVTHAITPLMFFIILISIFSLTHLPKKTQYLFLVLLLICATIITINKFIPIKNDCTSNLNKKNWEALKVIPSDAKVLSSYCSIAALSSREYIYSKENLPTINIQEVDYIVTAKTDKELMENWEGFDYLIEGETLIVLKNSRIS